MTQFCNFLLFSQLFKILGDYFWDIVAQNLSIFWAFFEMAPPHATGYDLKMGVLWMVVLQYNLLEWVV